MKKIIKLILLSITLIFLSQSSAVAGEIKERYQRINLIDNQLIRIEKKLDLILAQLIADEKTAEDRAQLMQETIDKAKDGAKWLKNKGQSLLEENQ